MRNSDIKLPKKEHQRILINNQNQKRILNKKKFLNQMNKKLKDSKILLKCLDCDGNFENRKSKRNIPSLIYSHLKETGHSHVEICVNSQKAQIGELICKLCQDTNVFELQIVAIDNRDLTIVCKLCHQKKYKHLSPQSVVTIMQAIHRMLMDLVIEKIQIENPPPIQPENKPSISERERVLCLTCNESFSNTKPQGSQKSAIISHLSTFRHNRIELTIKDKGQLRPKCQICGHNNIFNLSLSRVDQYLLIVCKECIYYNPQYTRKGTLAQPIDLETLYKTFISHKQQINYSFLTQIQKCSSEEFNDFEIPLSDPLNETLETMDTSDQSSQCESALEQDSGIQKFMPWQFYNSRIYEKHFSGLVALEKKKAIKQAKILHFYTTVFITKTNGKKQVSFDFHEDFWGNDNLKIGKELELISEEFTSSCWIEEIIGNQITASLVNNISDYLECVMGVEVKGVYPKKIFERLEEGLNYCKNNGSALMLALMRGEESEIQRQKDWKQKEKMELENNYQLLNQSQIQSIIRSLKSRVSIIQGPPGTGKTEVAACIISRLCAERDFNPQKKILVCCPSNEAIDNLAYRIFDLDDKIKILRVVGQSRQKTYDSYPKKYQSIILHKVKNQKFFDEEELIEETQVICTTCINACDQLLQGIPFEVVVIDECNQSIEPACLLPLMNGAEQLILLGDHKQLSPVVKCSSASYKGLKRSLFERLALVRKTSKGDSNSMLSRQYRMHPEISKIISEIFYASQLKDGIGASERTPCSNFQWKNKAKPFMFYNMVGAERQAHNGNSFYNKSEAAQVIKIFNQLIAAHVAPKNIGIISPYASQVTLIEGLIGNHEVLVNTAHAFQGKERDYIIMSCVRNSLIHSEQTKVLDLTHQTKFANFGHLADDNLINVSISRARRGLLIVGSQQQLELIPTWKKVLEYFQSDKIKLIDTPPCEDLDLKNATTQMKTIIQKYYL